MQLISLDCQETDLNAYAVVISTQIIEQDWIEPWQCADNDSDTLSTVDGLLLLYIGILCRDLWPFIFIYLLCYCPKMPKDPYMFAVCGNTGNRNSGTDWHRNTDCTSDGCERQFSGVCDELSSGGVREPSCGSHCCRDHCRGSRHSF